MSQASSLCGIFYNYVCRDGHQGQFDGTGIVRTQEQQVPLIRSAVELERMNFSNDFDRLLQSDLKLRKLIETHSECSQSEGVQTCKEKYSDTITLLKQHYTGEHFAASAVIGKYPSDSIPFQLLFDLELYEPFQSILKTHEQRVVDRLVDRKRINRIQNTIYPKVRDAMAEILNELPDGTQKDSLQKRIQDVTVQSNFCTEDLLTPAATYTHADGPGYINLCSEELFKSTSDFSVIRVLAHELAHSIDPINSNSTG